MKIFIILGLAFLSGCSQYVADNKYLPRTVSSGHSIFIMFDLILDEDVTIDDPRIKSIIYASSSKNYVVITYSNVNADKLANKIAEILTEHHVMVKKPGLINPQHQHNLDKYVVVYIKYKE